MSAFNPRLNCQRVERPAMPASLPVSTHGQPTFDQSTKYGLARRIPSYAYGVANRSSPTR
eukprot:gene20329-24386_t